MSIPQLKGLPLVSFVLALLGFYVLTPTYFEEGGKRKPRPISPDTLKSAPGTITLAPGVPDDQIPEYRLRQFTYLKTYLRKKEWEIDAKVARMFEEGKIIHGRIVHALLYGDDSEEPTVVTALESKYELSKRDLHLYGDVTAVFPDGFTLKSEYLLYNPELKQLVVPVEEKVLGFGKSIDADYDFESFGMIYAMGNDQILLRSNVIVNVIEPKAHTQIRSDLCEVNRRTRVAHFAMRSLRRFVTIRQPDMLVRSRTAHLNFKRGKDPFEYLTANGEVTIEELDQSMGVRYATCGEARFDTRRNMIRLTEFPQVYQDKDTVAGSRITIHRTTDIVEVEHSNAYSTGLTFEDSPDSEKPDPTAPTAGQKP